EHLGRDVDRPHLAGAGRDHPRQAPDPASEVDDGVAVLDARAEGAQDVVEVALALGEEAVEVGLPVRLTVVDEEQRVLAGALVPEPSHVAAAHAAKTTMTAWPGTPSGRESSTRRRSSTPAAASSSRSSRAASPSPRRRAGETPI